MERTVPADRKRRLPILLLGIAAAAVVLREALWALTIQLAAGALLMLLRVMKWEDLLWLKSLVKK